MAKILCSREIASGTVTYGSFEIEDGLVEAYLAALEAEYPNFQHWAEDVVDEEADE